ncbi:MAG: PorT family protein [Fibrobacter sp.]|nr:PorT family protein [Fibrobacter sp.]
MKKFILASTIAMMCLSANAFAEDDGYGNDIPAAREEGTVDDGYGNKLPANEPEYKTYGEARSSSGNVSSPVLNLGLHIGFGFGSLLSYPSHPLYTEYKGKKDEWDNYSIDFGGIIKYRVNSLLTIVPEVNLGFGISSREIDRGYDWKWSEYKVNESRMFMNVNVPIAFRLTPIQYLYLEAGARLNFNVGTSHSNDYTDKDGNPYMVYDPESGTEKQYSQKLSEWKVNTFIPSVIAGVGGSFKMKGRDFDFGIRFSWDLVGLEKDNEVEFIDENNQFVKDENGEKLVVKEETKWMSFQFIMNFYLF